MAETSRGRGSQSIQRIFVNDEGDPTGRAQNDTNTIVLKTLRDGKEVRCALADVFGGQLPPPCVGRAAAAFGLSTSIGNAGNSALAQAADSIYDGDDRAKRREALEAVNPEEGSKAMADRWADLVSGEWASEREIGPSTALLIEAVVEYRKVHGKGTTDTQRAEYSALFKDKEEVKNHLKVPKFREIYEGMRVARTLERLGSQDEADDSKLLR